jgi:alpha-tubulin suppressor-like RCC1 family protein/serine/threonine protein kinase
VELFDEALRLEPAHRPEFLIDACGSNDALFDEVSSLVAEYERRGDTLDPAPDWVRDAGTQSGSELQGNPPPRLIGRYEVGRELGRGGMGIVFEARDPVLERKIALKTIRLDGYGSPGEQVWLRARLMREAKTAASLSHPNIVAIYDSDVHEGLAFIAMELVDGPTLSRCLADAGRLKPGPALGILEQVAAALDYAHAAGVVHRDVKPSNIMLQHGASVKITDFGIAKLAGSQQFTRSTLTAGTPNYMSPEQIRNQPVDGRSDQFSLAVVAYEMLTGVKPFRAESDYDLMKQIVDGDRPSACAAAPDLPAAVDLVFQRALARNSADRYPTCMEFVRGLEEALRPAPQAEHSAAERQDQPPALSAAEEESQSAASVPLGRPRGSDEWVAARAQEPLDAPAHGMAGRLASFVQRRWLVVGTVPVLLLMAWFAGRTLIPRPSSRATAASTALAPLDTRHVVLQRDFERLGLRAEAYLDHRPTNPHRDEGLRAWRNVPAQVRGLSDVAAMTGGWGHTAVLEADGTVWVWGKNSAGELGDGGKTDRPAPMQLRIPTADRLSAVAAGSDRTLALTAAGSVWSWGGDEYVQAAGRRTIRYHPPLRVGGLSDVVEVAASKDSNLALKKDGTLWAWGRNDTGQLGDGSTTDRDEPVAVKGLTEVTAAGMGEGFGLALRRDGHVWAWGWNESGRLGDGTTAGRTRAVPVMNLSDVTAIAAGARHSAALKRDGTVWSWGQNAYGELGDGTRTERHAPVQVEGLSGVAAIAAGAQHTFALKRDGTVWAWGQNAYGELGDGTRKDRPTPARAIGLSGVVAIESGGQHGLARKSDGTLWTWGWNDYGQLGPAAIGELESTGITTVTINYKKSSGPTYAMPNGGFPWILFDPNEQRVLLHPGQFETSQWGAALGYNAAADGDYSIRGSFQRAYDFPLAGDGVDVAVVLDIDDAHPLWAAHIAADQMAKQPFAVRAALRRGQVVRFVVYSGPQGKDGTFDETALEATIDRQ